MSVAAPRFRLPRAPIRSGWATQAPLGRPGSSSPGCIGQAGTQHRRPVGDRCRPCHSNNSWLLYFATCNNCTPSPQRQRGWPSSRSRLCNRGTMASRKRPAAQAATRPRETRPKRAWQVDDMQTASSSGGQGGEDARSTGGREETRFSAPTTGTLRATRRSGNANSWPPRNGGCGP